MKLQKLLGYTNWGKLFKIIPWVEAAENNVSFGNRAYKSRYTKFAVNNLFTGSEAFNGGTVEPKLFTDAGF